jgi:hypothetical protein
LNYSYEIFAHKPPLLGSEAFTAPPPFATQSTSSTPGKMLESFITLGAAPIAVAHQLR